MADVDRRGAQPPVLVIRPRRLRQSAPLRRLVAETRLHPAELVLPVFVREGISEPVAISAMPGVVQHTLDSLVEVAREAADAGLGGIMVFGVPVAKDAKGPYFEGKDGKQLRTLELPATDQEGLVTLPWILTKGLTPKEPVTYHLRVATADGLELILDLKVTPNEAPEAPEAPEATAGASGTTASKS